MKIEIFSGPNCSYCAAAKALMDQQGLSYVDRDISAPGVLAEFRERLPRVKSIPQIFFDDVHIGGYDDLALRLSGD